MSGVRSDQPATGLRNKELSKGPEIDGRTRPKSVLCSTPRLVGRIAFCRLSFPSLSSLSKVGSSQTFFLLATSWAQGLQSAASPVVVSSFLTDPIGSGVKGFEPLHAGTKNRCLTTWLYSIRSVLGRGGGEKQGSKNEPCKDAGIQQVSCKVLPLL